MKRLFRLMILTMAVFFGIKGVKADTVSIRREYVNDIWSFHYRNGEMFTYSNLSYKYLNDVLGYCIEPESEIITNDYYYSEDFNKEGYSDEEKRQMELIAYYGYGYKDHNSVKYYMATQELIWSFSDDDYIVWNTSRNQDGENIDLSYEKFIINYLINKHNVKPSFYKDRIEVDNYTIDLYDSNDVLNEYSIYMDDGEVLVEGNKLTLKANSLGVKTLYFKKLRNIDNKSLVFDNDSIRTQTMAIFGEPNIEEFSIDVSFNKGKVEILKKDMDDDSLITEEGIGVRLTNIDTGEEIGELTFVDGKIICFLPVGNYKLDEVSTIYGYSINENGLEISVSENTIFQSLNFYNERVTGQIEIYKVDEDGNFVEGAKLEVYNEYGDVVDRIITTDDVIRSKKLPLGSYTLKEVEAPYGYELNNEIFDVNFMYDNPYENVVYNYIDIINSKKKCEITVITSSNEDKIDASFNIFDIYGNLIYSGKTENGISKINLPYGDYILKEIGVPNGYKLNEEEIYFSVDDFVCASSYNINNEKVIMPVTSSENSIFYLITLLLNIGSYAIYKKNK